MRNNDQTAHMNSLTCFLFFFCLYGHNSVCFMRWQIWCPIYSWAATWENQQSAYAKTKAQISFTVTAKLISAFVFATRIEQFLYFLNPKFLASSLFLWLYRLVCVRPDRKPKLLVFSCGCSIKTVVSLFLQLYWWCKLYNLLVVKCYQY